MNNPAGHVEWFLDSLRRSVRCERAVVLLDQGEEYFSVVAAYNFETENFWTSGQISQEILRRAAEGSPVLLIDAINDPEYADRTSVVLSDLRSVICIPLRDPEGNIIGLAYADSRDQTGLFRSRDLRMASQLAGMLESRLFPQPIQAPTTQMMEEEARVTAILEEPMSVTLQRQRLLKERRRAAQVRHVRQILARLFAFRSPASAFEVAVFTRQMATMVAAGLPLVRCLEHYALSNDRPLNRIINEVTDMVSQGSSLSLALKRHPRVFSEVYSGLIGVGEMTGGIVLILTKLAELMERVSNLRMRVRAALTYPMFMVLASLAFVGMFVGFVLPQVTPLFKSMDVPLPLPTRILVGVAAVGTHPLTLVALVLLPIALLLLVRAINLGTVQVPGLVLKLHRWFLKLPLIGPLVQRIITARLLYSLATMVDSGLPLDRALHLSEGVAGNAEVATRVRDACEAVVAGNTLADALQAYGVITASAAHLLRAGEESGQLGTMLRKVAELADMEAEHTLTVVCALIEPAIMLVMGLLGGFMTLAAILPTVTLFDNL